MPLSNVQQEALAAIAANRHPGSHVAGGTVINRRGRRLSKDIDIFHDLSGNDDRIRILKETVDADAASLVRAGFQVEWNARHPELYRAVILKDGEPTVLEWVVDSDFRFFPSIPDELFGFRLHMFDLATNKVLAAASRKEPRDVVDLVYINENCFPIAAAIWAAPAKDPGYTPERLIEDLRRNAVYRQDDFDRVMSESPIDARHISIALKSILTQALEFANAMPPGYDGMAFVEDDQIVLPDVSRLDTYQTVTAERQAHWPTSPDINAETMAKGRKF
ncbi:nucleotidyl transferase AbiEii/AbiGii toxin family protein [Sinorhizobium meliloti]|uniref:nucleotidyl transferase AbiEii/AbiGii toxin family protein n=1 Tax=Rhizobium meliloti TaxID=382 RepID=UPI001315AB9E|nr:nucleotidyl transferase AbiEii/AbiGii toxin family protein [Sinorhizobium meliloti]